MPYDYRITTPSGVFDVSSETELTDDQAYQAAIGGATKPSRKEQAEAYGAGFNPRTPEQQNAKEFLGGAKHTWDKAALGLKGVFTDLSPEDKQLLEQGEAFNQESGWRSTAGGIGTDLALGAAPVAKGGALLSKALGATFGTGARLGAVAGDIGANAGWSALTNPEDRLGAAKFGAGGAAAGRLLTGAVAKLGQPVKTTPITQMMLDEGIELTPGQAAKSGLHKSLEGSLYNTPFMPGLRRSIGQAQRAGQEQAEDFLTDAGRLAANPQAHGISGQEAQSWVEGANRINDAGLSIVPVTAILSMLHLPTAGTYLTTVSTLYGTPAGRRFLLGQASFQELLREAPDLAPQASQLMRAVASQSTFGKPKE